MLIDTHCHLDFPELAADRDGLMARARAAGVGTMITIATSISKFPVYRDIAEAHDAVFFSIGQHPHQAHEASAADLEGLVALSDHPKSVAIGEAGLDYHYDKAPRETAKAVFRAHIAAARKTGLPLVIHSRDADDDMAAILEDEMGKGAFPALLHCFTSSRELAERALALGLSISFSGVLTFKASDALRALSADVPLDRLLVETDAPFLAPVPFRGKTNEPAFVAKTAEVLAAAKGVSPDEIAAVTTANARRLFAKMSAAGSGAT